jgi:hypothetical protein
MMLTKEKLKLFSLTIIQTRLHNVTPQAACWFTCVVAADLRVGIRLSTT